jgi:hypothetical protein
MKFAVILHRIVNSWFHYAPIQEYMNKPINYLEIGVFHGGNILSVADTYGIHPDSKLYGIDPWEDYDDYPEYKNEQPQIYSTFIENLNNYNHKEKIIINKGYSNKILTNFENDFLISFILTEIMNPNMF